MGRTLTGVGAILSAAHSSKDRQTVHGHTWEVLAWWDGRPCAVEMQGKLVNWLSQFDHGTLPASVSRGEDLATQCLMALGCERVEVRREYERIYAVAEITS